MDNHEILDTLQAIAARTVDKLPGRFHHWLGVRVFPQYKYADLDPSLRTILSIRQLNGGKGAVDEDPKASRVRFRKEMAKTVIRPTPVFNIQHWTIQGAETPLRAKQYLPFPNKYPVKPFLLVYFHGGGFIVGDIDTHDEPCRMLCQHGGFQVLSVNYRLAPENSFPAGFNDCLAAFKWVKAHARELGVEPDRVCIGGDSAGGGLAAAVSAYLSSEVSRQQGLQPAAQLLIYPAIDFYLPTFSKEAFAKGLTLTSQDIVDVYSRYNPLGLYPATDPRLAPLYSPYLKNAPPTFVISAEFDALRDEGELFAQRLAGLGRKVRLKRAATLPHGFVSITSINLSSRTTTIQLAHDFRLFISQVDLERGDVQEQESHLLHLE